MLVRKFFYILTVIVLINNSCFSLPNQKAKEFLSEFFRLKFRPSQPIAKSLSRVMTTEAEAHGILRSSARNHTLNGHWSRFFNVEEARKYAPHHTELHRLLAQSIQSCTSKQLNNESVRIPIPLLDKPSWKLNREANRTQRDSFVEGHFLPFNGKTAKPKVLVTLYTPSENLPSEEPQLVDSKWFLPIEQSFLLRNLREYRRACGILKEWSAHTRLGLVVIPEGAEVSLRIGIASPQTFPSLKSLFKDYPHENVTYETDYERFISRFKGDLSKYMNLMNNSQVISIKYTLTEMGYDEREIWRLLEHVPGGITQILFAYAYNGKEQIPVIDVGGLYLNNKPFKEVYSQKREVLIDGESYYVWPAKNSHLLDPNYDNVELSVHRGLYDRGLLNEDEYNDFAAVISEIRAKETCEVVLKGIVDGNLGFKEALGILDREGIEKTGDFGKFRHFLHNELNFLPS